MKPTTPKVERRDCGLHKIGSPELTELDKVEGLEAAKGAGERVVEKMIRVLYGRLEG